MKQRGFLWGNIRQLYDRRDLIQIMTVTQIRARYQQSVLGLAWAVLQPLMLMLIFTVIFGRIFHISSEGQPYQIFSLSALIFWNFFSTSLTLGVPSLVMYSTILKKIYFPREIFPLVTIFATLFDLIFAGAVFVLMMVIYHVPVTLTVLWVIPLLILQTVLAFGILLFGSAICVKVRDIQWGIPIITQIWMYCTPIIYSLDSVPKNYKWLLLLNPMTGIIDGYRRAILHNQAPNGWYLLISVVVTVVVFYGGYRYFKSREMTFADIL